MLNLEVNDVSNSALARGPKTFSTTSVNLSHKSNIQEFGHYPEGDLNIGAGAEATLPTLIEACKDTDHCGSQTAIEERGTKLAEPHKQARARDIELAAAGWDAGPVLRTRFRANLALP